MKGKKKANHYPSRPIKEGEENGKSKVYML